MKITRRQLRQIIKKELNTSLINEGLLLPLLVGIAAGIGAAASIGDDIHVNRGLTDEEKRMARANTVAAFQGAIIKASARAIKRAAKAGRISRPRAEYLVRGLMSKTGRGKEFESLLYGTVDPELERLLTSVLSLMNKSDVQYAKSSLGVADEAFTDHDNRYGDTSLIDYVWIGKSLDSIYKSILNESASRVQESYDTNRDGSLSPDELRDLAGDLEDVGGTSFPPLSHPLISQYADKMRGPTVSDTKVGDAWGDPWYKEYMTYTYAPRPNNIQAKQSITLYRLLNDKYFARIFGSYNNRVSHEAPGEFDDPIQAIQAALDSSVVKGTTPAKRLINKVGTKITGNPTGGAWYD